MEYEQFKREMIVQLNKVEISFHEEQIQKFYQYMNLLIETNERMNLTAIVIPQEIIIKHFIDSLTVLKYIKEEDRLIDIGTGAGFPGLPIKIASESVDITLLDSLNKRVLFLNEVIQNLKLKKVKAIHSRAEDFAIKPDKRENYDVAVSRAVAPFNVLLEYMLPFVKVNGICICMKGPGIEEEIKTAEKALKVLGGEIERIDSFNLIDTDMKRNIILVKKIKTTPRNFPRKAGKPSKEPII